MNTMVEMRLATRKQGGSERFSCDLEFWNLMVELGAAFGWKALGATYVATSVRKTREPEARKRDYQPGPWRDAKFVDAQDASEWAGALSNARGSPHLNNLTKAHRESIAQADREQGARNRRLDADFIETMDEFTQYLRKGAFSFAAGDSEDITPISARK